MSFSTITANSNDIKKGHYEKELMNVFGEEPDLSLSQKSSTTNKESLIFYTYSFFMDYCRFVIKNSTVVQFYDFDICNPKEVGWALIENFNAKNKKWLRQKYSEISEQTTNAIPSSDLKRIKRHFDLKMIRKSNEENTQEELSLTMLNLLDLGLLDRSKIGDDAISKELTRLRVSLEKIYF
jgi:hypothetical protein